MIDILNQQFGLENILRFAKHSSGLVHGLVNTPICTGSFFLLGAHLAEFQNKYQDGHQAHPVLFMSREAIFEVGKPIRGGVPICFPWFGPKASDSTAPAHGLVRTELWQVARTECDSEVVVVELTKSIAGFRLNYQMRFGQQLGMSLTITNQSYQAQQCEVALHTYFTISDVSNVSIWGLETIPFFDKISQRSESASGEPIAFTSETDRVYSGSVPVIELHDTGLARTIVLRPQNSASTVVWNPWIEKSKRLADFGDDEYLRMCCIETANVGQQQLSLQPAESNTIAVEISVVPM
ncbi:MAG: D-hexose-6-phosphate mutarotase [Pirellulales bacterium]